MKDWFSKYWLSLVLVIWAVVLILMSKTDWVSNKVFVGWFFFGLFTIMILSGFQKRQESDPDELWRKEYFGDDDQEINDPNNYNKNLWYHRMKREYELTKAANDKNNDPVPKGKIDRK